MPTIGSQDKLCRTTEHNSKKNVPSLFIIQNELIYPSLFVYLGSSQPHQFGERGSRTHYFLRKDTKITLDFLISIDPQISIDSGKIGRNNKDRPSNKRRPWKNLTDTIIQAL